MSSTLELFHIRIPLQFLTKTDINELLDKYTISNFTRYYNELFSLINSLDVFNFIENYNSVLQLKDVIIVKSLDNIYSISLNNFRHRFIVNINKKDCSIQMSYNTLKTMLYILERSFINNEDGKLYLFDTKEYMNLLKLFKNSFAQRNQPCIINFKESLDNTNINFKESNSDNEYPPDFHSYSDSSFKGGKKNYKELNRKIRIDENKKHYFTFRKTKYYITGKTKNKKIGDYLIHLSY
jgi:hypothetical protein